MFSLSNACEGKIQTYKKKNQDGVMSSQDSPVISILSRWFCPPFPPLALDTLEDSLHFADIPSLVHLDFDFSLPSKPPIVWWLLLDQQNTSGSYSVFSAWVLEDSTLFPHFSQSTTQSAQAAPTVDLQWKYFLVCLFVFEIRSYYISLIGLELSMQIKLASNSQSFCFYFLRTGLQACDIMPEHR